MTSRSSATTALSLLLMAAGCATTEEPLETVPQISLLERAEALLLAGDYEDSLRTLVPLDGEQCAKRLRDRRDLTRARAEQGRDELWAAYLILERFADDHPLSELRPQVMEMLWEIGNRLIKRDDSLWFFWSDRTAARNVLEHLITRHPDSQRLADALRILGDMAFSDGDFELAQARYREIILERPDSDWRFYANYRFAMSIVAGLRGPDYDLDGMAHAATEIRTFMRTAPENPQMLADAERALKQVLTWQVRRHLRIAAYYRKLNNIEGELHHARMATDDEFKGLQGFDEAVALRDRLEAQQAAASAPAGGAP